MLIKSPTSPAEWAAYYDLRYRVLRQPWQQPRGSERSDDDAAPQTVHALALGPDGRAVAVGRLHPSSASEGQVRYMAVAAESQGQGLGGQVLSYLEGRARELGLGSISLHAREAAVPFYQQHGYEMIAPSHLLFVQIQHYLMRKQLPSV
ncbi:GNAT family N-acetyltransferase [Hymenobacter saemangeumensis]